MWETLKTLAPTVASALEGPAGSVFIAALGQIIGDEKPTLSSIASAITEQKLTPDHIVQIRQLEEKAKQDERENDFRYAEIARLDRDSARKANVDGGIQGRLFLLSLLLIGVTLGSEVFVLFAGIPKTVPDVVVGRVLGLMDAIAMMVLTYYYGTTNSSAQKTQLLAKAEPVK